MEYRYAQRDCYCRTCRKDLKKDVDKAVYSVNYGNREPRTIICEDCVAKMFMLVSDEVGKLFPEDRSHWGYSDAGIEGKVK